MEKDYITASELKNIRKNLGVSQREFADLICSSKPTIERWEREKDAKITGPVVALVRILSRFFGEQVFPAY